MRLFDTHPYFEVFISGPQETVGRVTPLKETDALYEVSFTPETVGNYLVSMRMRSPLTGGEWVPFGPSGARYACAAVCYGSSLSLDGTSYLRFDTKGDLAGAAGEALELYGETGVTLEGWVRTTAVPSKRGVIARKGYFNNDRKTYGLEVTPSGFMRGYVYVGGGVERAVEVLMVLEDVWHHYAASYDGTTFHMYVDGALAKTSTWEEPAATRANVLREPLVVGGGFSGKLDEVGGGASLLTLALESDMLSTPEHLRVHTVRHAFNP